VPPNRLASSEGCETSPFFVSLLFLCCIIFGIYRHTQRIPKIQKHKHKLDDAPVFSKGYLAVEDWKTVPKLHYLMLFAPAQVEIGTAIEAQAPRLA